MIPRSEEFSRCSALLYMLVVSLLASMLRKTLLGDVSACVWFHNRSPRSIEVVCGLQRHLDSDPFVQKVD